MVPDRFYVVLCLCLPLADALRFYQNASPNYASNELEQILQGNVPAGLRDDVEWAAQEVKRAETTGKNSSWDSTSRLRSIMSKAGVSHQKYLTEWGQCGPIRKNYRCSGKEYNRWLEDHLSEMTLIDHDARAHSITKNILFIGNSVTREIAETLMCMNRKHIKSFYSMQGKRRGCLREWDFSHECSGGEDCNTDFARSELHGGANIYIAVNHPWLFQGDLGMSKAFKHLDLQVPDLDVIVLGVWNDFNPQLHNDDLRGCHENIENPWQGPWSTEEVLAFLFRNGFKGEVLLSGHFSKQLPLPAERFGLNVSRLTTWTKMQDNRCNEPLCRFSPTHMSHQCIPGPTSYVGAEVQMHLQ